MWLERLAARLDTSTEHLYWSYGRISRYAENYGLYDRPKPVKQPRRTVRVLRKTGHSLTAGFIAVISLLTLLWSYLVALKRGTCPFIETPTK